MEVLGGLGVVDWVIFGLVLVVPLFLTVFLGVWKGGTQTNSAYLLGNRNLSFFPVALSLAVSYLSAVTISGVPGEVYYYGTLFPWTYLLAVSFALITLPNIFIPVFHKMHLTSVYEYLELRYSSRLVRRLGSLTFIVTIILYLGVALYAPCISLSLMTGGPVWAFIIGSGLFSVLVTAFGGLRTVVWTDAWQAGIMIAGLIGMIVLGLRTDPDGFSGAWFNSVSRGRIQLADWSTDPTQRTSTLSIFFGQLIQWGTIFSCHQTQVQRFCSTKSISTARWSLAVNLLVIWIINLGAILAGLVIFNTFRDCDPLTTGQIQKTDSIATYFVQKFLIPVHGLGGLFLGALVSGALSSVSSGLNSLASVLWEDFLSQSNWAINLTEAKKVAITRCLASGFGLISTGLALGFSRLDGILKVAATSIGMLSGPLLSIFLLGYFLPFTNKIGASVGIVVGNGVTIWVAVGALFLTKGIRRPVLETSIEGCDQDVFLQLHTNSSSSLVESVTSNEFSGVDYLYNISPFLYPVLGFIVSLVLIIFFSLLSLPCWKPRPPPSHLVYTYRRRGRDTPPPPLETAQWEDQDSHYRVE
ncbi:sodium-coupled monocarboxylate transporter 2 isoform X2 [Eurytemora carolleeae]|uniref:sodium-coupled monocarboxylate transporter 2 isoform X2 n=1 Tax=Eurytemora carolleeae TaxID=1294199 RepID=UPI000C76DEAD|nr:sodium-coupled monocarboxylate transporter 2 isoform X2 [Eurytemora carolleeae]|eukprot:XP_023323099.1 sodium-coupled monocarboxylate transporter 2-like isoform X2 [Eurytemora affinis]